MESALGCGATVVWGFLPPHAASTTATTPTDKSSIGRFM
jgi:hypothetical protein